MEWIPPGEKYAKIIGMIFGRMVKPNGWICGGAVYILDGKVYEVTGNGIEVWPYFDYCEKWRKKEKHFTACC